MKFRQLVYTSYKGYGEKPEATDYYARTPGIADSDAAQIADLFGKSMALERILAKYPTAESLDAEALSRTVPKRYSFIRLKSGSFCWCVASIVPRRFGEKFGVIYFHALVCERMPDFLPIALFDRAEFSYTLTDDQFEGIVPPTPLPAIEIDDSELLTYDVSQRQLGMRSAQMLISAANIALTGKRHLLIGNDGSDTLSLLRELFSYYTPEEALPMSFSTLSDVVDAKRFVLNGAEPDFDMSVYTGSKNRAFLAADIGADKFSLDIVPDKFAMVMTQLVYTDIAEYDRFCDFLNQYKAKFNEYDIEAVLRIYYFIYTERYLEYPSGTILDILEDRSFAYVDRAGVAAKLEAYIENGADKDNLLELYARLYRYTDNKAGVLDRVIDICFNDIVNTPDPARHTALSEFVESNLDASLYAEILRRYDRYSPAIVAGVATEHIFSLVIAILRSNLPRECSEPASRMFKEIYAAIDSLSPTAVRDALLPAVTFNRSLYDYCVEGLYDSATVSFEQVVEWLTYCESVQDKQIADTFVTLCMTDLVGDRLFNQVVNNKPYYQSAIAKLSKLVTNPAYDGLTVAFVDRVIAAQGSSSSADRLIMLLGIYKWDMHRFVEVLRKIREHNGEELFTSIVYAFTKTEGVEFVRSISADFADIALRIVSHNVKTPESYVEIYIKQFFNSARLTECWSELFRDVTAECLPDVLAATATEVLKAVHSPNDSPIVIAMCKLVNDNMWKLDHANRAFITEAVEVVRGDMTPDSNLSEIKLFADLLRWEGNSKKGRTIASIFNVVNLAMASQERCRFVCKNYTKAVIGMSKVFYKKQKNNFLLKVLLINATDITEQIWDKAYKKERRGLRTKVIFEWLDFSANVLMNNPGYRSSLIARIFSDMKAGEFMKLFKIAKKKNQHHILNQLRSYFDSLPEKTQNKVAAKLINEFNI